MATPNNNPIRERSASTPGVALRQNAGKCQCSVSFVRAFLGPLLSREGADHMRHIRRVSGATWAIVALAAVLTAAGTIAGAQQGTVSSQGQPIDPTTRQQNRQQRFTPSSANVDTEVAAAANVPGSRVPPVEAPAGFDNLTNGFDPQGPAFDSIDEDTVAPLTSFNDNRFIFEEVEDQDDGLGPTYNAQSCRECHQNVVTGGPSQIAEQRAGHLSGGVFFESQGGSLIHSRGTHPDAVELVKPGENIRTFRLSTTTVGLGFVEAIANQTLLDIRDGQPAAIRGTAVVVPVLEAKSAGRVGRFGWKAQHASLHSFAADAYLNEMGITSPLLPDENTIGGADPGPFDDVDDPEDDGVDVIAFANFMRSTKAPPRGPINPLVSAGETVFVQIGCAGCHIRSITTAAAGTIINGGALTVRPAVGNKIIHPYSDFLLHDVGTGDGIPIQPTAAFANTANKIRTAPLWGLRTRNRLMHDGLSFTREEAILRHAGQAAGVTQNFRNLSNTARQALLAFLNSL
jgi:hypothetical protein